MVELSHPVKGLAQACGVMLCGICVVFPFAVIFTFMNEKTSVCREWAIESAGKSLTTLDCAQHQTAVNGVALTPGTLGFLACDVDKSTFKKFTGNDFVGLAEVDNLFAPAVAPDTGGAAAAMTMTAQQWQCEETCTHHQTVCNRRLEDDRDEQDTADMQEEDPNRRLLSQRFPKSAERLRRLKSKTKAKTCHQGPCDQWSYRRILSSGSAKENFNWPSNAAAACGNPPYPTANPVPLGAHDYHANDGTVKLQPKQQWALNSEQLNRLPIAAAVNLAPRAISSTTNNAQTAPKVLSTENTYSDGVALYTCSGANYQNMGCLSITFNKAVPNHVSMLGATTGRGIMNIGGWNNTGYWLCKGSTTNNLKPFCPSKPETTNAKGMLSCGEDITQAAQMITVMKDANWWRKWVFRAIGFSAFWMAIACCLQPINYVLTYITDLIDAGTDCIPCVGSCVDCLTDIFMGIVHAILCVVSCCCAVSCFLAIVTIAWIVMRPVVGSILAVVACLCCTGAGVLTYLAKQQVGDKTKSKLYDEDGEDDEGLEGMEDMDSSRSRPDDYGYSNQYGGDGFE